MRRFVATLLICFAVVVGAHAADNDEIQQGIFDSYLKLALKGDVVAQYVVAQSYENGRGTDKNMEKAFYWYEMAAKKKYPLAVVRLEEHNAELAKKDAATINKHKEELKAPAPAPAEARKKKEPAKKPIPARKEPVSRHKTRTAKTPAAPVHVSAVRKTAPKPVKPAAPPVETKQKVVPPPMVVARAPVVERPLPTIKVMDALLNGKWMRNRQDAEFLPSSRATCLQSSNTEVVCFSREFTRNVGNTGLTYNVKSVISGIDNKDARFNLRYIYNVVDIAGKPFAQPSGMASGINDMAVKAGWQEPGVSMECRMRDERSLTCTRVDRKMSYQFVRE